MRRVLVGVITTTSFALPAMSAHAGGSWLETEKSTYAVGELAVAEGLFGRGAYDGTVRDGPFYAYLVPGHRSIGPGRIPGYAVPLGSLSITPATGNYCCWIARVEFMVPDVPAGNYRLQYCNDPCTVHGIGDLEGGSFFVGQSSEEARLFQRVQSLRFRIERLRTQRDRVAERAAVLRAELDEDSVAAAAAPAPVREATPASTVGRRPPGWAAITLAAALVFGATLQRARRQVRVPDFVPPDLAAAQVPSRQPTTSVGSPGIVSASPGISSSEPSPVTKS